MAASKEELFWMAPGVVNIAGKEYGANEAIPTSKVGKDTLAKWKETGKVGAKIAPVRTGNEATKRIAELEAEAGTAQARIAELEGQVSQLTEPKK